MQGCGASQQARRVPHKHSSQPVKKAPPTVSGFSPTSGPRSPLRGGRGSTVFQGFAVHLKRLVKNRSFDKKNGVPFVLGSFSGPRELDSDSSGVFL
jgi:hypothetical protein